MSRIHLPIPLKKLRRATIDDLMLPANLRPDARHLFRGLPRDTLEKLARHGVVYRAQSNVAVREQDNDPESCEPVALWYIIEGNVHIEHYVDGRPVTVGSLGPGDLVGEVEQILGCPSSFSIVSVGYLTYIEFEPPELLFEIADKELLSRVIHLLARKLRDRARKAGLQRTKDVTATVREYLENVAKEEGLEEGTNRINMTSSLNGLAVRIGISRQSVQNAFAKMAGFKYKNSKVTVLDKQLLAQIGGGRRTTPISSGKTKPSST